MAVLTITTTTAQDARIATAFGARLGLTEVDGVTPRDATLAEVKAEVVEHIRNFVSQYERQTAAEAARDAVAGLGDVT